MPDVQSAQKRWSNATAILIYIALATVIIHLFTGTRYGFHRDELATLDDARHLAWGYVAYPPLTPFFGRLSLILFGTSLTGFRFFAGVAEAIAVVLTGLMARELGGERFAQLLAAAAAIPFCLAGGSLMQYVSFDYLWWVLVAYSVIRLLRSGDPRWWLVIGAALGLGMMTKYTIGVLAVAVAIGVVLTDARRYLKSKWLWYGVVLSVLIPIPNLLWQYRHHFISLDFIRQIHERDIRIGRTKHFLPEQLELTQLGVLLCIAGLYFFFFSRHCKRFCIIGWMYVLSLVLFILLKGRSYYLAAAYPMLYAGGSVWFERWTNSLRHGTAIALKSLAWVALALNIVLTAAFFLPLAPINSRWWNEANHINGDLREEIGWPELVQTVAQVRDRLPQSDRAHLGILAADYGEAGAINLYGPQYGLPSAISGINSFYDRGYGDPPPDVLILVGFSQRFTQRNFTSCELVARSWNAYGVANEQSERPDIYVCRGLRKSWPDFWKDFRYFG